MDAEVGRYVVWKGLEVTDAALYAHYRAGMTPILARANGTGIVELVGRQQPGQYLARSFSSDGELLGWGMLSVDGAAVEPAGANTTWNSCIDPVPNAASSFTNNGGLTSV